MMLLFIWVCNHGSGWVSRDAIRKSPDRNALRSGTASFKMIIGDYKKFTDCVL